MLQKSDRIVNGRHIKANENLPNFEITCGAGGEGGKMDERANYTLAGQTSKWANVRAGRPGKKLLVTGASGFVGRYVCRKASGAWQVLGLCRSCSEPIPGTAYQFLDLTDLSAMARVFGDFRPDAVIHLAAMSGLAACQRDPASSYNINVAVSRRIAELCAEAFIPCVFTSTDIVFDGCCPPYSETDPVTPINVYGEHKALAETAMLAAFPEVSVCRLSLVFGMDGRWVRPDGRAMFEGVALKLFEDEYRTPIRAERLVDGLFLALEQSPGILHLGGGDRISRYDFGLMIAEMHSLKSAHVVSCRQKGMDLGAPRPADVSLNIDKARALGFHPGSLREEVGGLVP